MNKKQNEFLSRKHERESFNFGEFEEIYFNSQKKTKNNENLNIIEQIKKSSSGKEISLEPVKIIKTIAKIKNETIEKFNKLSPEEKK